MYRGLHIVLTVLVGTLLFSCAPSAEEPVRLDSHHATTVPHPGDLLQIHALFPGAILQAPAATFAQDADTLRVTRWRSAQVTQTARVVLPLSADGETRVEDLRSKLAVQFALQGARPAVARPQEGLVIYPGGGPGATALIQRVHPGGTEDFVIVDRPTAASELRYRVDVRQVAGLRLVANTLEFLDASGTPRLRMSRPYLVDARGERLALQTTVDGCAVDRNPRAPWGRAVTPPGSDVCQVVVSWQRHSVHYPLLVDPQWVSTFNTMVVERTHHTVTRLMPNSAASWLLVAGGFDNDGMAIALAELYDPISRTFVVTSPMAVPRGSHTATPLTTIPAPVNQRVVVLLAGGLSIQGGNSQLGSLEVYNPMSGTFHMDAYVLTIPRYNHTATLFAAHKVLIAGGRVGQFDQVSKTAEVYTFTQIDPSGAVDSTLQDTVDMSTERSAHTATRLPTGQVLIAGGVVVSGPALNTAEVYVPHPTDPSQASFSAVTAVGAASSQMSALRARHTATLLDSGAVLLAGGANHVNGSLYADIIDVYHDGVTDPTIRGFETFSPPVALTDARAHHTATRLPNGHVVFAGGQNGLGTVVSTEQMDPTVWPPVVSMVASATPLSARRDHAAAVVNAGESIHGGVGVFVCGGSSPAGVVLDTAQVLLQPDGDLCDVDSSCLSGFCTEGVCCNVRCDAACASCTATGKGNGQDGICGHAAAGTPLGSACSDHTEVQLQCDGSGQAETALTVDCEPYVCDATGVACRDFCGGTAPCATSAWCDLIAGECTFKLLDGETCTESAQCATDNCVGDVCCAAPCSEEEGADAGADAGAVDAGVSSCPEAKDGCSTAGSDAGGLLLLLLLGMIVRRRRRRRRRG